ncbi:unnamed protein product [Albugo candida]|uniref:Uncharacterized protein n=1 Tax=Albugo candida TaxID=65357 RepID=A0A024FT29_9STRA|nr:unnamed protein product [Albugo candida]|eukprot:CCI10245.1 unnamed protein product [Albugo candida]
MEIISAYYIRFIDCIASQAVTLHFVWIDRSRRLFDQRSATPTVPALFVIYTTHSANVRYFRRQRYDQDESIRLAKVLAQLEAQVSFGGLFRSRRSLLLCSGRVYHNTGLLTKIHIIISHSNTDSPTSELVKNYRIPQCGVYHTLLNLVSKRCFYGQNQSRDHMIGGNAFVFGKNQLKHLRPMKKSSGQFQFYGLDECFFSPQICDLQILRKADVIYAGFYVTLESGSLKKAIREVLSLKSKSSPERHHSHAHDLLLPHSLARSFVFSADIIDAILDMDWNYDYILTLSWKRLEKPTLYFGSAAIVVIIHIFFYVKNARKKQSGHMLGPINLEITHSIDGLESAMHKEHEIYFDFARIISEVPSEFYETMKARLIRLTGTDTSFDCTHRELYRLPSIKLKGACTQQLYEFTSQEYIVGCLPQRKILELQEDSITWQSKQVQMVTDGSSALHSSNGIHSTSRDGMIMNVSAGMRSRCTRKQNLVYHFEEIYSMKQAPMTVAKCSKSSTCLPLVSHCLNKFLNFRHPFQSSKLYLAALAGHICEIVFRQIASAFAHSKSQQSNVRRLHK